LSSPAFDRAQIRQKSQHETRLTGSSAKIRWVKSQLNNYQDKKIEKGEEDEPGDSINDEF